MKVARVAVAAAFALGAGACEPPPPSLSPDFGRAVQHNMMVHIVGPNLAVPDMDGGRAALRQDQYRKGQVVPVRDPTTTQAPGTTGQPRQQ